LKLLGLKIDWFAAFRIQESCRQIITNNHTDIHYVHITSKALNVRALLAGLIEFAANTTERSAKNQNILFIIPKKVAGLFCWFAWYIHIMVSNSIGIERG
jgi:hypothetical protein